MSAVLPKLKEITCNRWFAVGLLLMAGLLLTLVVITFDDDLVPLPGLYKKQEPIDRIVPVKGIARISTNLTQVTAALFADGSHPFFTAFFKPPPPQPVPPPPPVTPPPPALKKVVLLYQGLYQTAEGQKKAFLKSENKLSVLPAGAPVLNDWIVADITPQKLTLTNAAAQTTILEFNREKTIEVPEQKQ